MLGDRFGLASKLGWVAYKKHGEKDIEEEDVGGEGNEALIVDESSQLHGYLLYSSHRFARISSVHSLSFLSDGGSNLGIFLSAAGGFWSLFGVIFLLVIFQAVVTALGPLLADFPRPTVPHVS